MRQFLNWDFINQLKHKKLCIHETKAGNWPRVKWVQTILASPEWIFSFSCLVLRDPDLIFHDYDLLDGVAILQNRLYFLPGVKAAQKCLDLSLVDGVHDAVISQVCIDRDDADVVLESPVSRNWNTNCKPSYSQIFGFLVNCICHKPRVWFVKPT